MSLIGTLEQIDVKNVLRRVEEHSKTGLFVIKQDAQWVEMYFRDGKLMRVGPAHIQIALGEWLIERGILSVQAWQEVMQRIGGTQAGEMRTALTLMELEYVSHDELRAWAMSRANKALKTVSSWTMGEMYFEDNIVPPADQLLVALSIVALFTEPAEAAMPIAVGVIPVAATSASASSITPVSRPVAAPTVQSTRSVPDGHVSNAPTLMEPAQFFSSSVQKMPSDVLLSADEVMTNLGIVVKESDAPEVPTTTTASSPLHHVPSALRLVSDAPEGDPTQLIPSASALLVSPLTASSTPKPIDTSFMQPDMLLVPSDLSALHEQNSQLQLTPEQWRMLTLVNGQTTLWMACQALQLPPERVCQLAGELMDFGLIRLVSPSGYQHQGHTTQPFVRETALDNTGNNYMTINSGTASVGFPSAPPPSPSSFAQSQWGNGANGAMFVPDRGWVISPRRAQPSGPMIVAKTLAYMGR